MKNVSGRGLAESPRPGSLARPESTAWIRAYSEKWGHSRLEEQGLGVGHGDHRPARLGRKPQPERGHPSGSTPISSFVRTSGQSFGPMDGRSLARTHDLPSRGRAMSPKRGSRPAQPKYHPVVAVDVRRASGPGAAL